ncbi:MAG TPA: hypothetical protein VEV17_12050 [Bryobacteraceae bacterium]|nr:hypothetical protein [Bryobacteraceae bacterium]
MSRVTVKSSTIFISVGSRTEVYRSVEDVPPGLRKQLEQSTNGIHSATILIADRKGKEEIVRAIRGLPSSLRSRLSSSLRDETPSARSGVRWAALYEHWVELLVPAALGLAVWLLFSAR